MARNSTKKVEEPIIVEETFEPEVVAEPIEEEIVNIPAEEEFIADEETTIDVIVEEEEVVVELPETTKKMTKLIDNFFAELLFADTSYRKVGLYDVVTVTADKNYIGSRAEFLIALASAMVKEGGIVRIAEDYFTIATAPAIATKENGFWIIKR